MGHICLEEGGHLPGGGGTFASKRGDIYQGEGDKHVEGRGTNRGRGRGPSSGRGRGTGDRDIWSSLPVPHYQQVLRPKGTSYNKRKQPPAETFVFHACTSQVIDNLHLTLHCRCMFIGIKALNTTSLNITLLNLMGMAIDHFLAIVKPLHYPVLMHKRRASAIIAAFWLVAVLCGFSDFMSGYSKYPRFKHLYNYCEFVYLTKYQEEYPTFAIALMCAIVMITSYVIILRVIRRCHRGIGAGAGRQDNAVRNQKAVVTTLLILGTFLLCWLPMCLFQLALIIQVKIDPRPLQKWIPILSQADTYLYDLLMLNAICDPIIYAVRMREIRAGYQRLCPCCAPKSSLCTNTNGDTCHTTVPLELHGSRKINKLPQESFPMTEIPSVKKQVTISKSGYMKAVAV